VGTIFSGRRLRSLSRFLKKLTCVILAAGMVLMGAPVQYLSADDFTPPTISGGGRSVGGAGMTQGTPALTPPVQPYPSTCEEMQSLRERLQRGMPTLQDAIDRTDKMREQASEEDLKVARESALEALKVSWDMMDGTLTQIGQASKMLQASPSCRQEFLKSEDAVHNAKSALSSVELLSDAYNAGNATGQALENSASALSNQTAAAKELFRNLFEECAMTQIKRLSTQLGAQARVALELADSLPKAIASNIEGATNAYQGLRLKSDVNAMRDVQGQLEVQIQLLDNSLNLRCVTQAAQPSQSQPFFPPPEAAAPAYTPPPPSPSASSGSHWGWWLLGGAVLIGGGAAAAVAASGGSGSGGGGSSSACGPSAVVECLCGDINCVGNGGLCQGPCSAPDGSSCGFEGLGTCGCSGACAATRNDGRSELTRLRLALEQSGLAPYRRGHEALLALGKEHLTSGSGRSRLGHSGGHRRIGRGVYALSMQSSGIGAGMGSGGAYFASPSAGDQTGRSGAPIARGTGYNGSMPDPLWPMQIDEDWSVGVTPNAAWAGAMPVVSPTFLAERKFGSYCSVYGEDSGGYSVRVHTIGGGAECAFGDRQQVNFDASTGVSGIYAGRFSVGYTIDLDNLYP
jgi:hypothetical protein